MGTLGLNLTYEYRVCACSENVPEDATTPHYPRTYRHEHHGSDQCYDVNLNSYLRVVKGLRVDVDMDRHRLLIVRHFSFGSKVISVPYDVTASVYSDTYE